jgi:hypothetical protein
MTVAGELIRLRQASLPALRARYRELTGEPLKASDQEAAWRAVARALQSLPPVVEQPRPAPAERPKRAAAKPKRPPPARRRITAGTVLTRIWRNREIRVRVLDVGFEFDGAQYRSLSAVASAITGAHWNGRLFFGLVRRGKPKR